MDNPKTALVKSKSSNSTSEARKNTQKTSRSSAEFSPRALSLVCQPLMLKKRSVYVAKKPTKLSFPITERSPDVPPVQRAASPLRPIPRPSKKRFLTSVLNILSKSTAGTQCPDETEDPKKMEKHKTRINKLKMRRDEEDIREEWTTSPSVSKRKNKFKSRILNSQANRESVTVLRSKKDIVQSSSNDSKYINVKYSRSIDPETVKWAERLPPLENDSNASAAYQNKKIRINENNSDTMIADIPAQKDKSFYDFFVDMLKTTLNVYNETEVDNKNLPTSANSSKITLLEMKQSVACKLKMPKAEEIKSQTINLSRPSSQHAYSIIPEEKNEWTKMELMEQFQTQLVKQTPSSLKRKKRKLKADSFQLKKPSPLPKTTSMPTPSKYGTTKRDARKEFLNLLTEELQMKTDTYEEPENFFDALKVIAKNKKRNREWNHDIPSEEDDHICQFKPRRVLSRKSSAKQSSYYTESSRPIRSTRKPATLTNKKRKIIKDPHVIDTDISNHSLEVLGYDYERPLVNKKRRKKSTSSFISSLQTPPTIMDEISDEFWCDYSDNDTGPMREQRQYVLDKLGQLWINRDGE